MSNNSYKVLGKQTFNNGVHAIVPIRMEDRYTIMQWRNEQLFHLRQDKPLSRDDQDNYFESVIAGLFGQEQPGQVLFSYLEGERCIGYGGLVHINWIDKNAEISFITYTAIKEEEYEFHMSTFLNLIEEVAFKELGMHKLFTYTFDVRPKIYPILEKNQYTKEAVLREHCSFDGRFLDVIIHSKISE